MPLLPALVVNTVPSVRPFPSLAVSVPVIAVSSLALPLVLPPVVVAVLPTAPPNPFELISSNFGVGSDELKSVSVTKFDSKVAKSRFKSPSTSAAMAEKDSSSLFTRKKSRPSEKSLLNKASLKTIGAPLPNSRLRISIVFFSITASSEENTLSLRISLVNKSKVGLRS